MSQIAFVIARPTSPLDPLGFGDRVVAGVYRIEFKDGLPANQFANATLDAFHSEIPVVNFDSFNFEVLAEDLVTELLVSDEEGYQFADARIAVDRVDDLFQVWARFTPEAWINDYAVEIDGACDVDVTEAILKLGGKNLEELRKMEDRDYPSDHLVDIDALGHSGPFSVDVVDSLKEAFDVDDLSEITVAMLVSARKRAFV